MPFTKPFPAPKKKQKFDEDELFLLERMKDLYRRAVEMIDSQIQWAKKQGRTQLIVDFDNFPPEVNEENGKVRSTLSLERREVLLYFERCAGLLLKLYKNAGYELKTINGRSVDSIVISWDS